MKRNPPVLKSIVVMKNVTMMYGFRSSEVLSRIGLVTNENTDEYVKSLKEKFERKFPGETISVEVLE